MKANNQSGFPGMQSFKLITEDIRKIFPEHINPISFYRWNHPVVIITETGNVPAEKTLSFREILSEKENKTIQKLRFRKDQNSYIITHATLRLILGKFLDIPPGKVDFITNPSGKPLLPEKHKDIHFNLSHSSGVSTLAFSAKSEIGVDVEKIDPGFDYQLITRRYFSTAENDYIRGPDKDTFKRFYTLWTRKEAFLKAVGMGIGENLEVEVCRKINYFSPEKPFAGRHATDFYLKSYLFQSDYVISVAANDPCNIEFFLFDPDEKDLLPPIEFRERIPRWVSK
jgi:phosphopantetheinyl transferase